MQEVYNEILQEKLYIKKLDNGLTVLMMPRSNFNKSYAIFATNYGSIDNNFINPKTNEEVRVPDGIAHFLEHKLFESKDEDTFSKFARLGASANAFTNYNMTAYLFHSTRNFIESVLTLLDFVQDPYFTDENVEKEKGIIAQEIRMYDDEPNYQVYVNLINGLFHKHPVKIDIAGTVESINQITKEDLYLCYNTFYNPGNMVLFLTGNFHPNEILQIIEENQAKKDLINYNKIERIYPEEPSSVYKNSLVAKMDLSQPLFRLGIKERFIPNDSREIIKQDIATEMLLDLLIGKSTTLYQNLYDQGLLDDNFGKYYTLEKDYGFVLLGGKTKDPELLYKKLLEGFKTRITQITKEEYNRIYRKNIGEYVESYNSFESIAYDFISYYFKGINFFDILDLMQELNLDYLVDRFENLFNEENIVRSIVKPN